jgi:hypothetical protein
LKGHWFGSEKTIASIELFGKFMHSKDHIGAKVLKHRLSITSMLTRTPRIRAG